MPIGRLSMKQSSEYIRFQLLDEQPNPSSRAMFHIDHKSGEISLKKSLNTEISRHHIFVVEAYNILDSKRHSNSLAYQKAKCAVVVDVEPSTIHQQIQFLSSSNTTIFLANFDNDIIRDGDILHQFVTNLVDSDASVVEYKILESEENRTDGAYILKIFNLNATSGALSVQNHRGFN